FSGICKLHMLNSSASFESINDDISASSAEGVRETTSVTTAVSATKTASATTIPDHDLFVVIRDEYRDITKFLNRKEDRKRRLPPVTVSVRAKVVRYCDDSVQKLLNFDYSEVIFADSTCTPFYL
ncbi:MAG: hypothetical protein ACREOZ_02060, partial [Gloeomargaritales cyanobacterium]